MRRNSGREKPAEAIRSFLRFLVFRGEIRPGLEAAAPSPPQWKYASLPSRLTPEEVERVLAVYPDGSANSLRNRAMLFLLARLGLRAQEVVSLCLEDIDWADGRFDLRPGKTRRARNLPRIVKIFKHVILQAIRNPQQPLSEHGGAWQAVLG